MTIDRDLKDRVRARMAATGQTYTAARADLLATPAPRGPATDSRVVSIDAAARPFFDGERLRSIPTKRRARAAVLLALVQRFEPGREYAEREVNAILADAHDDFAWLRRELVNYRYVERDGHARYRVVAVAPERDANEAQEVPVAEADWFAYAASRALGEG